MSLTRTASVIAVSIALVMLCSCATKKYVRQEVATTQAQLSTRIDEEAARRTELANQVGELTALNKKNTARIEQVQGNLDSTVKTIEPKIDEARNAGVAAGKEADAAMNEAKGNAAAFANRNNFQVLATQDVYFKVNRAELDDDVLEADCCGSHSGGSREVAGERPGAGRARGGGPVPAPPPPCGISARRGSRCSR